MNQALHAARAELESDLQTKLSAAKDAKARLDLFDQHILSGAPIAAPTKAATNGGGRRGRRPRSSDIPPLAEAIARVMGNKTMTSAQILTGLQERGWMPSSSNPRQYISFTLSKNKDTIFQPTGVRGEYRVRPGVDLKRQGRKASAEAQPAAAQNVDVENELAALSAPTSPAPSAQTSATA